MQAQYSVIDTVDHYGNKIKIKINKKTDSPHRIYNIDKNLKSYGYNITRENIGKISKKLINDYKDLIKISFNKLKLNRADKSNDKWYINFQQYYKDIPIYNANIGYTINKDGYVVLFGSDAYPNVKIDTKSDLSSNEVLEIAIEDFKLRNSIDSISVIKNPELTIYPIEGEYNYNFILSYNLILDSLVPGVANSTGYFICADKGSIIKKYPNGLYHSISGNVNINYWPEHHYDTPQTDIYKYGKVALYGNSGTTLWGTTYTSNLGYYQFSDLNFDVYLIIAPLLGSYVEILGLDVTHRYSMIPGTHNWTWDLTDASNVYYHATTMHDYFKGYPFYYNDMDFTMKAYVNQGNKNGWAVGGNEIGFGTQDGQHFARSSDAIYHEYTHNTIYHLNGNKFIGETGGIEGYSIDEGIADYFACSKNNDHIMGESLITSKPPSEGGTPRDLSNSNQWDPSKGKHWNGTVIGGACWDLRQALGTTYVDKLVFDALYMSPHADNFEDFAENIAIADDDDQSLNNSVPHYYEIQEAFEINHGIQFNVPEPGPPPPQPPLPPQNLVIINAGAIGQNPHLTWNASSGSTSYNIYRRVSFEQEWWQFGSTSSTSYTDYTFEILDPNDPNSDEFFYHVKAVNGVGESDPSNSASVWGLGVYKQVSDEQTTQQLPQHFELQQNYPNPFNPETEIRYSIPKSGYVELIIVNLLGQPVRTLLTENQSNGWYTVMWDGKNNSGNSVGSSIYFYRIAVKPDDGSKPFTQIRKMSLLR